MPSILPISITVCGFAELSEECEAGPSHVLPLLDPDVPMPPELSSFAEDQRLELRFPILSRSNRACARPNRSIFVRLLALGGDVLTRAGDYRRLLIHCHAGFSRSPAAFAVLLAQARLLLPATAIAEGVMRVRPTAWPNLRLLELGDHMLDRRGELITAAALIYRYRLAQEPGLADILIANGRAREVEAARG